MVQHTDVQDLLNTGTWTTRRAKDPRPSNLVRANQSSKLDPLDPNETKVPRSFPNLRSSRRPPPPTVEDEEISVARELNGSMVDWSNEEPQNRGTIEQLPILLPVSEYNSERRFVLVSPSETDEDVLSDDSEAQRPKPPTKTGYMANSKIQLDPNTGKDFQPNLQRPRSRAGLPRLETDVQPSPRSRPASYVHRSKSATCVDQQHQGSSSDYFSPYPSSAGRPADAFLSPEVIKHATKGRDRAYWNLNAGSNGSRPRDSSHDRNSNSDDRKGDMEARSSPSAGPGAPRRLHSDVDVSQPRRAAERYSSYRDEAYSRTRNGPPSPSLDRRQSPPRLVRKASSPARNHAESHKYSHNRSTYYGRSSPPKEPDLEYSSDEHGEHRSHNARRNRRKSTVIQESRPNLLSPTGPRPMPSSKSKSRPPSPLPSPKTSQTRFPDYKPQPGPRTSATFNVARDRRRNEVERPVSPLSSGSSSSPRSRSRLRADDRTSDVGRPRAPSRAPSIRSNASSNKPVNVPPPINTTLLPLAIPSDDRKRQTMPPSPAWSRQGSLETIPHPPSHWQPESSQPPHQSVSLTPRQSGTDLEQSVPSVMSYRRYSEDVNAGTLPGLPDCPRQRPRAGHADWRTLPKCDNFNVCPSCYEQVFCPTEFRDLFVAAPIRSRDKEIACDLGTSPWYRIAWLMSRKYRRNDLRLLQGIADVSARHKVPCYGPTRVTRIWYSIIDPQTRRCISNFTVCSPCAEAVQVLFPSLTGVFVPLDRPAEPRPGKCSLHFAPSRNRFVTYFDVLESTHDRAMASHSAPNIQRLADKIGFWAEIEECPRDEPIRHELWYTMAHIPEVTVCEECFMDVVYPELVADVEANSGGGPSEGQVVNSVARNFYQKAQLIRPPTVCQMASPWMRDLFRRACKRHDGIDYLDARVRERLKSL